MHRDTRNETMKRIVSEFLKELESLTPEERQRFKEENGLPNVVYGCYDTIDEIIDYLRAEAQWGTLTVDWCPPNHDLYGKL